jgi:hypothetical protein
LRKIQRLEMPYSNFLQTYWNKQVGKKATHWNGQIGEMVLGL